MHLWILTSKLSKLGLGSMIYMQNWETWAQIVLDLYTALLMFYVI